MIDDKMMIADSSAQYSSNTVVIGSGGEVEKTLPEKVFVGRYCEMCKRETAHEHYLIPATLNRCLSCLLTDEQIKYELSQRQERWKGYGEEKYVPGDPDY